MTGENDPIGPSDDRPELPEHLRTLASELTPADRRRVEPPPEVWDGIVAALGLEPAAGIPGPAVHADDPVDDTTGLRSTIEQAPELPPVGRNAARTWLPVAAAVIVAVVGAIVTLALNDDADERVVATGTLVNEGLAVASDRSVAARLVDVEGRRMLEVSEVEPRDPDGFVINGDRTDGHLEVWMADPAIDRVVSLGILDADGRYPVPADLALEEFPVVDVSVEQLDGDPSHSGFSIWRGTLNSAGSEADD